MLHYIKCALTIHDLLDWKSTKENYTSCFLRESHSYSYKVNAILTETENKLCAHPLTKNLGHLMLKMWKGLFIQKSQEFKLY